MRGKENKDTMSMEDIARVVMLLDEAKRENWEMIEEEIIPEISKSPNGDGIARELLRHTQDEDHNIRDAVATGLTAVQIKNERVLKKAIDEMAIMATTDEEKMPAGKAAIFLMKYKEIRYTLRIQEALTDFRRLVDEEGWKDELVANIPQLDLYFKNWSE